MFGGVGQVQHGVDIYIKDKNANYIGIQCKKVARFTYDQIEKEIEKVKNFKPALKHYLIATSTNRNVRLQEKVNILNSQHNPQLFMQSTAALQQRLFIVDDLLYFFTYRKFNGEDHMNQSDIQLLLYRAILLAGASLSLISIIGNYLSSFPLWLNLKWIVLFFITVIAFIFSNNKRYTIHIMLVVFLFLISIFLPFAFVDSGGSNNNAMGYTFLLLIATTYLFNGWRRLFLVAMLIVVFMALHALEYYHPEMIAVYSEWSQFMDRMIQIPLLLLVSFLIILRFAKEYERMNQKLNYIANFDELTGLYNRRMFNKAMEEAERNNNEQIQLALLDLDNFKKVNDKYGHYIGDEVLKELSALLQNTFGLGQNIVSRWGGDEFAIIYYGEKDELIQKLEVIREAFRAYVSAYEETAGISTSIVSFSDYDKVSQTLIAADHQLYKEKMKKPS